MCTVVCEWGDVDQSKQANETSSLLKRVDECEEEEGRKEKEKELKRNSGQGRAGEGRGCSGINYYYPLRLSTFIPSHFLFFGVYVCF